MWGRSRTPRCLPPLRRPVKRYIWQQFLMYLALGLVVAGLVSSWRTALAADLPGTDDAGGPPGMVVTAVPAHPVGPQAQ